MNIEKFKTKDKIIYTTIYLIANEGINNTSAGNIANHGGFNKSNIFYYFDNIDQLFLKSLERSVNNLSPILGKDFSNYENISDYLYKSIENLINDENKIIFLKVILSFVHQSTYLQDNLKDLRKIIIDDLIVILIQAINYYKKKDLTGEEIESIASLLMTTFNGLGVLLLIEGSNEKFLRNWKVQAKLINNYIK